MATRKTKSKKLAGITVSTICIGEPVPDPFRATITRENGTGVSFALSQRDAQRLMNLLERSLWVYGQQLKKGAAA